MRKTLALLILLILTTGLLSACLSNSYDDGEHPLIGTWISDINDFQYDFHEDGTGIRGIRPETESFRWRTEDGYLIMNFGPEVWPVEEWSYNMSRNRNSVTFTNRLTPGYEFPFSRIE